MNVSIRTCIGCLTKRRKNELLRLVVGGDGKLVVDPSGRAPGRGAYLCSEKGGSKRPNKECIEKAAGRKAFRRAFRRQVDLNSIVETEPKS